MDDNQTPEKREPSTDAKADYEKPVLVEIGIVAKLTLGPVGSKADVGAGRRR